MDSKYNLLSKSSIASTIQSMFKRKYGNGNGNVQNAKKAKLQSPQKNGASPVPAVSPSTSNGNGVSPRQQPTSIIEQKKKLPIYGVKAPYVDMTHNLFCWLGPVRASNEFFYLPRLQVDQAFTCEWNKHRYWRNGQWKNYSNPTVYLSSGSDGEGHYSCYTAQEGGRHHHIHASVKGNELCIGRIGWVSFQRNAN